MAETRHDRATHALRVAVRLLWVLLAVAALYVAGVFYSRWDSARQFEQRIEQRRIEEARRGYELAGGGRFDILQFYASPGVVRRGESLELCYGVSNARKVRLEPQPNPVWPALARCVRVAPTEDTTYVLTIEDAEGNTRSASLTVQVYR